MKKIVKILLFTIIGLAAFLLVLAGITQTQFFRDRLRSAAISTLDSLLLADVRLGELKGNLLTGFTISDVSLTLQGEHVATVDRLDLRYDLFQLPGKKISVDNITLVRPRISLIRGVDGVWNFERLVRRTGGDTSKGSPFDWPIVIRALELWDGTVQLVDSAALAEAGHGPPDESHVEYHQFDLRHVNLRTSLLIRKEEKKATISALSFMCAKPDLNLDSLSGEFRVTPGGASVRNLEVRTNRSHLSLTATMNQVDLLGGLSLSRLQHSPLAVKLRFGTEDMDEFGMLLPPVDFLKGPVSLELEAEGSLGQLTVKKLNTLVGNSELSVTGELLNLHRPSDLVLNTRITSRGVALEDARRLMPSMGLPDFPMIGPAALSLTFQGRPLNFSTKGSLETKAGAVRSDVRLVIGGAPGLTYDANVQFTNLDLALITGDAQLKSSLRGSLQVSGKGVSPEHIAGTLQATLDTSSFMGQKVEPSRLFVEAVNRALHGNVDLRLGSMRSALTASVEDISRPSSSFEVEGEVHQLNLEDILRNRSYNSDLTMNVRAEGHGLNWENLTGVFNLDITSSRFADYRIEGGNMRILVDQRDSLRKVIAMESNIADFELKGSFDLEYLLNLIAYEARNIRIAVGEKFASLDSTLAGGVDRTRLATLGLELGAKRTTIDASYLLNIKDLVPLSRVTGNRTFNGVGVLRGAVLGDYNNLSLDGRLSLRDFFYGNADSGILIQNAEASFQVTDLKPANPLKELEVFLLADASKMHLNRSRFDSLAVSFTYTQEYSSYSAHTRFGKDLELGFKGIASVAPDGVSFSLNGLDIGYKGLSWEAEGGATARFSAGGIRVSDVVLRHETQLVTLSGFLTTAGELNAEIRGTGLDLSGIRYFLEEEQLAQDAGAFSGTGNVTVSARGTVHQPEFNASLRVDRFAFRGVPLGTITADLSYAGRALRTNVAVQQKQQVGPEQSGLVIQGVIPLVISFAGSEAQDSLPPMDLTIRSSGAQMGILDPLLPTFNQLSGILTCDLRLKGSLNDPTMSGTIAIDSCYFLFVPNNISYSFQGRFQPSGNRIRVVDALIRNVPADNRQGREGEVRITGDFALRELTPSDFDLNIAGALLVVKETTRKSSLSVYGNLFVRTDTAGLHFTGTIERSLLRGYVLVKNSTLVFPPAMSAASKESERAVPVVFVDDTSRVVPKVDEPAVQEYFGSATDNRAGIQSMESRRGGVSFLDGLRYDLVIESSGGNTEIRMVFNPTTGEELVANLDGKFSILEDGTKWVGTVKVDRAFYNFTKRFDATGSLTYTGDYLNPELDITATYAGTRTVKDSVSGSVRENVVVTLKITGTRLQPKLEISMTIDGRDYATYTGPKSSDVNSDAIQFLLTGNFPLTESQKNDIAADLRSTVGTSLMTGATSLLSSTLSDFLRRETGFINSVEIGYGAQGSFGESADIRISGVLGDGLWRVGGKVLGDPFNNANVSLLYSLGDIFRRPSLRNFMFELERRIETPVGQLNDRREVNAARLFYRLSF